MLDRLMSRLTQAGQRERDRMGGAELSPLRALGLWFGFLRPSRLLKLLALAAVALAVVYFFEFRAAAESAAKEAGPGAGAARIEALTVERLALTSCSGTRRSCGVVPGKQTLYRQFGSLGTVAIFVLAGAGLFGAGRALGRRRAA